MATEAWLLLLLVALLLGGLVVGLLVRRQRRKELRSRFGPEYDHAVTATGSRTRAEAELAAREERVKRLRVRTLDPDEQARFADRWRDVQARFVDNPAAAIADAEALLAEVVRARGYPAGDFDHTAADLSVDYPDVVPHYRSAHQIADRSARGESNTEELRQAMVHYRALFEELLRRESGAAAPHRRAG